MGGYREAVDQKRPGDQSTIGIARNDSGKLAIGCSNLAQHLLQKRTVGIAVAAFPILAACIEMDWQDASPAGMIWRP